MDNKSIFFVLIIIILLLIVGLMGYNLLFNNTKNSTSETIIVGSANFTLPNGYSKGTPNTYGDLNITNGKISIFLLEYPDNNVRKHIEDYENINGGNQSLVLSNFTYNGIVVFKGINDHSNTVHYWYVYNNKTYSIYSWDYNKLDDTVKDLIQLQKFQ